jgi:hypothetical protein
MAFNLVNSKLTPTSRNRVVDGRDEPVSKKAQRAIDSRKPDHEIHETIGREATDPQVRVAGIERTQKIAQRLKSKGRAI